MLPFGLILNQLATYMISSNPEPLEEAANLFVTECFYTKSVTCSKCVTLPFVVTGHILTLSNVFIETTTTFHTTIFMDRKMILTLKMDVTLL